MKINTALILCAGLGKRLNPITLKTPKPLLLINNKTISVTERMATGYSQLGLDISGEDAFKLYDTYGFPFDLTQLIARENNLEVDEEGFHDCMRKQKEKAKLSGKFKISSESLEWISVSKQSDSAFIGYDSLKSDSSIIEYHKPNLINPR